MPIWMSGSALLVMPLASAMTSAVGGSSQLAIGTCLWTKLVGRETPNGLRRSMATLVENRDVLLVPALQSLVWLSKGTMAPDSYTRTTTGPSLLPWPGSTTPHGPSQAMELKAPRGGVVWSCTAYVYGGCLHSEQQHMAPTRSVCLESV